MRKLLLITSILVGLSGTAFANPEQTITGPTGPVSAAQNYGDGSAVQSQQSFTKSSAASDATAKIGNVKTGPSTATNNVRVGGTKVNNTNNVNVNSSSGNGNGGGYDYGNMPVSSAYAPSFGGGANSCSGGSLSGGLSFNVVSGSLGGTEMDDVCRAQKLGELDVAREVMCDDSRSFRRAAYRLNRPCMVDAQRWNEEHPKPQPVAVVPEQKFVPSPWCKTASVKVRKANPLSCGE